MGLASASAHIPILPWALLYFPSLTLEKDKQLKSEVAAEQLLKDYRYLLSRAQTLSDQCDRGMHIVMNNAMIKESREAIAQAGGVAKLTRLAFLFIPLSFTTSFWGMNFKQLGTGNQDIRWCFIMLFPIFIIAMIFMKYEVSNVRKLLKWGSPVISSDKSIADV